MSKQLRYLALASFAFMLIAALALALFSQQLIERTLLSHGEHDNRSTLAVLQADFPGQFDRLRQSASARSSESIQQWFLQQLGPFSEKYSANWIAFYQPQGGVEYRSTSDQPLKETLSSWELDRLQAGQSLSELISGLPQQRRMVVTWMPLLNDEHELLGVWALASDITAIYSQFETNRNLVGSVVALMLLLMYAVLFFIMRYADTELKQQHVELERALDRQLQIKQQLEQRVAERTAGLQREVAERQQAELGLREKERYLQAVMANTFNGIICIDKSGAILSFNPTAEQMFGYRFDEVAGRNVKLLMPTEHAQRHDGYIKAYLDSGQTHIIGSLRQLPAKRRDGSEFPIELAITETEVNEQPIFVGTIRDDSEQKAAEQP
jgi:PAS domain S-box-containing protein